VRTAIRASLAGVALALPLAVVALGAGCRPQAGGRPVPAPPALHVVTIKKIAFDPGLVTAAPGDTIMWQNEDLVPHTVTARTGGWGSGNLPPDSTWRWIVTGTDSAAYFCSYHTTMHGVVRIAAGR